LRPPELRETRSARPAATACGPWRSEADLAGLFGARARTARNIRGLAPGRRATSRQGGIIRLRRATKAAITKVGRQVRRPVMVGGPVFVRPFHHHRPFPRPVVVYRQW